MPITGTPRTYLTVSPPPKVTGGLLAWANVVSPSDPHMVLGGEYLTIMCQEAGIWADLCTPAPATPCNPTGSTVTKNFDEPELIVGDPIVVYAGVKCHSFTSAQQNENLANARMVLEYTEDRVMEQQLLQTALTYGTDLGAGPFGVNKAMGLLEQWLDLEYAGQGLIHMSRQAATEAQSMHLLEADLDGRLRTINGTPVVNGRGYYTGTFPAIDGMKMFATGQVTLIKGKVVTQAVDEMIVDTATCYPPRALAERVWTQLVECGIGYTTTMHATVT
jgi:hypothetical protein